MNKLKAQLIKNMQAELDKLKEDLLISRHRKYSAEHMNMR